MQSSWKLTEVVVRLYGVFNVVNVSDRLWDQLSHQSEGY
jgi:hypothetical protein